MILGYRSQHIKNMLDSHCDYACTSKVRESGMGVFIHLANALPFKTWTNRNISGKTHWAPNCHQAGAHGLAQVQVGKEPAARESHPTIGVCTPARDCGCG